MNQHDKRKLENELLVMGLAKLDDPELIQQMASLVSHFPGDKHEFLRDLLNECDPENRHEMYEAIAPKLTFKALSLAQYEAQICIKAGEMISQRRMRVEGDAPKPIEIGGRKFALSDEDQATNALATLKCHVCMKSEQFLADTPVSAMIDARKAGWIRKPGVNKETCATCAAEAEPEVVQMSRSERLIITDRRVKA